MFTQRCLATSILALTIVAGASAFYLPDATIVINRNANNRNLVVRYSGAAVAKVEMRINGGVPLIKDVSDASSAGEVNFTLEPRLLEDGENTVEFRLFDATGAVVGSEKTTITMERNASGPVYLKNPARGSQVRGQVEISVGFEVELRDVYVSFFVDDQFQALRNTTPYRFLWDTTRLTNGWHEVQAYVIDGTNNSYKTERVRVFVNNPGGRTDRTPEEATTSGNNTNPTTTPPESTRVEVTGNQIKDPVVTPSQPTTVTMPANTRPPAMPVGTAAGTRPMLPGQTSPRPNGLPTFPPANTDNPTDVVAVTPPVDVTNAASVVAITFGARVPNIGAYTISMNGSNVAFDVEPRVVDNIPLTPFRHLFEHAGGEVRWDNLTKTVEADGLGQQVWFRIGDDNALLNGVATPLEYRPFIDRGRSIVPLSFISQALNVAIQFDSATGHTLISTTTAKN
ncbi:MAG: hypothetical protein KF812_10720 [Fimbriimonadaceae bacterium]|nr:hypothetical protein [Fimbriimonadaceae bacterium]